MRAGVKALIRDRFAIAVVAGLIAIVGVVAFYYPVQLRDYDPWGIKVPAVPRCRRIRPGGGGRHVHGESAARGSRIGPTQYAAQCNQAVWIRRGWSVPLTLAGVIVVGLMALGHRPEAPSEPESRESVTKD